jgi:hypothetical protein
MKCSEFVEERIENDLYDVMKNTCPNAHYKDLMLNLIYFLTGNTSKVFSNYENEDICSLKSDEENSTNPSYN